MQMLTVLYVSGLYSPCNQPLLHSGCGFRNPACICLSCLPHIGQLVRQVLPGIWQAQGTDGKTAVQNNRDGKREDWEHEEERQDDDVDMEGEDAEDGEPSPSPPRWGVHAHCFIVILGLSDLSCREECCVTIYGLLCQILEQNVQTAVRSCLNLTAWAFAGPQSGFSAFDCCNYMSRPVSGEGAAGQRSMTTPEKTLQRMLNTTGLTSESDAEGGSKEEEEDDDEDDEPDLDALATRLSAKVGAASDSLCTLSQIAFRHHITNQAPSIRVTVGTIACFTSRC